MPMRRLHPEADDDDPLSSCSTQSSDTRCKSSDISLGVAATAPPPATTMTTDASALSTASRSSNCASPGSDFHTHAYHGRKPAPGHAMKRPRPSGMGYVKDEPLNIRDTESTSLPVMPTMSMAPDIGRSSSNAAAAVAMAPTMTTTTGNSLGNRTLPVGVNSAHPPPLPATTPPTTTTPSPRQDEPPTPPETPPSTQDTLPATPPPSGGGIGGGGGGGDSNQDAGSGSPADGESQSLYSLHMARDFRYYFQHPYFRLAIAYLVTFLNFLIYAEDPVSHSEAECFIPVVGNCFSFVCTKYPPNGWAVVKVLMWLTAIITGLFVGKLLIHDYVFNRFFKLKMFFDDKGSWMTMFFTVIFHLFLFSHLYNAVLLIGGESTRPYHINEQMGMRNSIFMKIAACGTWCGDFFTAWMVTDVMLQEKLYPQWAKWPRSWWNKGRVILFWTMVLSTTCVFVMVISTDWIQWDRLNRDFMPTNELSRAFLASFILVFDLLIVMQDWDFPHFIYSLDIKLPGVNTAHIRLQIPKFLRKEVWAVHITGKWFNYGIIFLVMILDLNMWKNQMFYSPFEYGQYVGPNMRIHTVHDQTMLRTHNITLLSYEWRSTNWNPETNSTYISTDMVMNTQYIGVKLSAKGMAFIPSLLAFVCFGILVWYFGRWKPTETDHYAGRLKMRKKRLTFRQRIQQSFARRRRLGGGGRESHNGGASKVNLVRLKAQGGGGGESSPKAVFSDNSEPDYEPLTTTVVEDSTNNHHHVNSSTERLRAPLATPEKV